MIGALPVLKTMAPLAAARVEEAAGGCSALRRRPPAIERYTVPVDEVLVRAFSMDDYESVADLWRDAGPGLPLRPSDARDQVELKLTRDPDLFLVAVNGAGVVGAVMGGWDGRRGYVYHLGVRADVRRRGVATALMDELEVRLRARGALKVKCQALARNAAGIAFLRGRGYLIEEGLLPLGKEFG